MVLVTLKMSNFQVSDFLKNYYKEKKTGECKSCSAHVGWSRDRVAGHKRGTCPNATAREKKFFAKRKFPEAFGCDLNQTEAAPDISLNEGTASGLSSQAVESLGKFNNNNCYVCNFELSPFRYSLGTSTKYSITPVYELLGKLRTSATQHKLKLFIYYCRIIHRRYSSRGHEDGVENLPRVLYNLREV